MWTGPPRTGPVRGPALDRQNTGQPKKDRDRTGPAPAGPVFRRYRLSRFSDQTDATLLTLGALRRVQLMLLLLLLYSYSRDQITAGL